MGRNQHWAAVLSVAPSVPLDDPHPASAAAVVNGITYCSTILPWRGVKSGVSPWHGRSTASVEFTPMDYPITMRMLSRYRKDDYLTYLGNFSDLDHHLAKSGEISGLIIGMINAARQHWDEARAQLIAGQENLDWEC